MDLPKKIKIGCHVYEVKDLTRPEGDAHALRGFCSHDGLFIKVDFSMKDSQIREVLLHEIFHAIFNVYNIQESDDEERVVFTLGVAFAQVIQDNKEFREWLSLL